METEDRWKRHISGKLVELLAAADATQVELAAFAQTTQGSVGDHIRRRAFPKLNMLFKYSEFFTRKLGLINADPSIQTVLIICPASLRLNWRREAERWLTRPMTIGIANKTFPETAIVIINYDILRKHREAVRSRTWDLLVADECHYLKNPKTIRTIETLGKWNRDPQLALSPIPARRRVYLTGTPIVNRPIELWPILHSTGRPEWRNWKTYVT